MQQDYTELDIIRYLYDEVSPDERLMIQQWLIENWPEQETSYNYEDIMETLGSVNLSPSETSVRLVMSHARSGVFSAGRVKASC